MGERTCASVVCALVLAAGAPLRAQTACEPARVVEGCGAWLDVAALERALETEGVACAGARIACDGGRLFVDGGDTGHSIASMPAAVRARIVALLVAERLRVRAQGAPGAMRGADAPEPAVAPSTGAAPARDGDAADTPRPRPRPDDRAATAEALAAPTPVGAAPPAGDVAGARARRTRPTGLLDAADDARGAAPPVTMGLGAEVRGFVDPWTTLAGPLAHVGLGALHAELGWAFGRAAAAGLGDVGLSLGHLSAGVRLVCLARGAAGVCASALATVGVALARPEATAGARGRDEAGGYGGGTLEVAGWVATERAAVSIALRGGWGYGLVVRANGEERAALGGGWVGARLGVDLGVWP